MSLQTRLAALIQAIKGDFDDLEARITSLENAGGGGLFIAKVRNSAVIANINSAAAWTTRQIVGINDEMDAGFSPGPNGIICGFNGRVKITTHIAYNVAGARVNVLVRGAIDGVGLPIQGRSGYVRNASGHTQGSAMAIDTANVTTGQEVQLQTFREAVSTITPGAIGDLMIMVERT